MIRNINNLTKEELKLLNDSKIKWTPDLGFNRNHNAIIWNDKDYEEALKTIKRK